MKIRFYNSLIGLIAIITTISCNNDNLMVQNIINGNTIQLNNGSKINLIAVKNTEYNRAWLKLNVLNKPILLFDRNKIPIDQLNENNLSAYVFSEEGLNVNETINKLKQETNYNPILDDLNQNTLQNLYQKNKESVFLIFTSDGESYHQGSGFFISGEGIGVSNYHVFESTLKGKEVIKTLNGNEYKIARIIKSSKELDYIIFELDNPTNNSFPHLNISSIIPKFGESVFTIGNPKGLESTLSTGIVSSLRDNNNIIQTTTEITHGSSGGPLFNMSGEVIGITSSGLGEANLNFAVNIQLLETKLLLLK